MRNAIERAVILSDGETIAPEHFVFSKSPHAEPADRVLPADGSLEAIAKEALRAAGTERIAKVLKETRGNKSRAAEVLKVSYKTLLTKTKDYGIES